MDALGDYGETLQRFKGILWWLEAKEVQNIIWSIDWVSEHMWINRSNGEQWSGRLRCTIDGFVKDLMAKKKDIRAKT